MSWQPASGSVDSGRLRVGPASVLGGEGVEGSVAPRNGRLWRLWHHRPRQRPAAGHRRRGRGRRRPFPARRLLALADRHGPHRLHLDRPHGRRARRRRSARTSSPPCPDARRHAPSTPARHLRPQGRPHAPDRGARLQPPDPPGLDRHAPGRARLHQAEAVRAINATLAPTRSSPPKCRPTTRSRSSPTPPRRARRRAPPPTSTVASADDSSPAAASTARSR